MITKGYVYLYYYGTRTGTLWPKGPSDCTWLFPTWENFERASV